MPHAGKQDPRKNPSAAQLLLAGRRPPGAGRPAREGPAGAGRALPAPPQGGASAARREKDAQLPAVLLVSFAVVALLGFLLWFFVLRGVWAPQRQVLMGFQRTFSTLHSQAAANGQAMGTAQVLNQLNNGPVQQRAGFSTEEGRLEVTAATNLPERRADLTFLAAAAAGEGTLRLQLEGDLAVLSVPGAPFGSVGVHTQTLGYDLAHSNLGQLLGVPAGFGGIGFNLFEILAPAQTLWTEGPNLEETGILRELFEQAAAERRGRVQVPVNGVQTDCVHYTLVFEGGRLLAAAEALVQQALAAGGLGSLWPAARFLAAGGAASAADLQAVAGTFFEELRGALKGDVYLDAYLAKGALVRADFEFEAEHAGAVEAGRLQLAFGGQGALSEQVCVALEMGQDALTLCVEAAYLPADGVYGGQAQLRRAGPGAQGGEEVWLACGWSWASAQRRDNFRAGLQWNIPGGAGALEAAGFLETDPGRGTMLLELADVCLEGAVFEAALLQSGQGGALKGSLWYEVAPLAAGDFAPLQPDHMPLEMSESQLRAFWRELENAYPA